jgi:hypothetical protein
VPAPATHPAVFAALREVFSRLASLYGKFVMTKLWNGGGEFDPGAALRVSDLRLLQGTPEYAGKPLETIRSNVAAKFRTAARGCRVKAGLS